MRIYRDFTADMPTKPKGSNETIETAQKSSLQRNMFHYSLISVFAQTTRSRSIRQAQVAGEMTNEAPARYLSCSEQ